MAKAFYNDLTCSNDADAAGTNVVEEGQTLAERKATTSSKNFYLLDVMSELGIDISQYRRRVLMLSDLRQYDLIVSMASKDDTPQWLLDSDKYVHWEVADPRDQDYPTTAHVRDIIKQKVSELVKEKRPRK